MEPVIWPYVIYSVVAIALTTGLAMTLNRHGKVFLAELFPNNVAVAKAINSLLLTGFFMLNLGYSFLISRTEEASTSFEATEGLIQKLGILLVSLGAIHFMNMAVFWRIRRNMTADAGVPVPANTYVAPPPMDPLVPGEAFEWAN